MQISLFLMLVWEIVVSEVEVNAHFLTLHLSHHMMMDCKNILEVRVCVLIEYTRTHKLFIVLYVCVCVCVRFHCFHCWLCLHCCLWHFAQTCAGNNECYFVLLFCFANWLTSVLHSMRGKQISTIRKLVITWYYLLHHL